MSSGTERIERKLAAIFCADVADYSRLMHADEVQTLRILTAHRAIMDGLIAQHGGRIANTAGDSILAEFPSVVDAVECAVAVQEKLGEANVGIAEDRALRFRIGIHVGDIAVRGGDLLGDGVNVAARVQALADPGGVWISSRAFEEIEGKIDRRFEDRGEQQVKNIARPVRVYALSGAAPRSYAKPLSLPDKPSIAVLPFTNMSGDPEQQYFADGVVDDIITALSRFKLLFVAARNSSFTYKGQAANVRLVGHDLGVRYVLEGSIRRAGQRIRITGQLVDTETMRHVWADRIEGAADEVFELQDNVTTAVVSAIAPEIEKAEIKRTRKNQTTSISSYEMYLRAKDAHDKTDREQNLLAQSFLDRAIELDPTFAMPYALAARCRCQRRSNQWVTDRDKDALDAERLARKAIELGSDDASCLSDGGFALAFMAHDLGTGGAYLDRALALNRNLALAWLYGGWIKFWQGDPDSAIERLSMAIRLSPLDPMLHVIQSGIAHAHFHAGRYTEAVVWAERSGRQRPGYPPPLRVAAAALALDGNPREARRYISEYLRYAPRSSLASLRSSIGPWSQEAAVQRFADGLRLAGYPE